MTSGTSISNLFRAFRNDGWQNILTGLGMANRDKRMAGTPVVRNFSQAELEDLYRADDIAQKVVNRIPKEMFRAGYKVKTGKTEDGKKIEDYLTRLKADEYFRKGLMLARLHGGAGIVLGIEDDQDASMPVKLNAIKSIKWLAVLDRWRLVYHTIQEDLSRPGYGLPLTYQIQSLNTTTPQANTIIHASRVIRFDGVEIPERAFISNNYWSDSYLATIYNPLLNYNSAHDGAATTMQDFIQTVYELENLAELIASGDDVLVQKRLALLDATRSIIKAIVIQKGENFRRENVNITGMPELLGKIENRLVASCNMPHTIVLGEGSQGQTSGSSEKMDFYDLVAQEQVAILKPKQMELISLICLASDGPKINTGDVSIEYNALWEPTAVEDSQVYKTNAEADALYIDRGVIDPIEVTRSRFGLSDSEIQVDMIGRDAMSSTSPTNDIQATALNGAQVASLLSVIEKISLGQITTESATSIIKSAFPLISEEEINGMVASIQVKPASIPAPQAPKFDAGDMVPQRIFLSKNKFETMDKAAAWIVANNYSNAYPLETELSFEFLQRNSAEFLPGSLVPTEIGEGVKAIIGSLMPIPQAEIDILNMANLIRASL